MRRTIILLVVLCINLALGDIVYYTLTDTDLSGTPETGDYKTAMVNQAACEQLCSQDPVCSSYAWTAHAPNSGADNGCSLNYQCCYMKKGMGQIISRPGINMGIKHINPLCSRSTMLYGTDLSSAGTDYRTIAKAGINDCEAACCADSKCTAWSHSTTSASNSDCYGQACCYLKWNSIPTRWNRPLINSGIKKL